MRVLILISTAFTILVSGFLFKDELIDIVKPELTIVDVADLGIHSTVIVQTNTIIPEERRAAGQAGILGSGTGVIIKTEGDEAWIITNRHVIDNVIKVPTKLKLEVTIAGRPWTYPASLVGYDSIVDVAVLKIKKQDREEWNAISFSEDTFDIVEGESVVSVGHGAGLFWSVTSGIISGTDRFMVEKYNFLLQHDAVINQGNSGGAVFNMNGEIVCINELLLSPGASSGNAAWNGISLCIPSWQAKRSVDQILEKGFVTYPEYDFGIDMISTPKEVQDIEDITKKEGRLYTVITNVPEDSKAQRIGLKEGDIIVSLNNQRVVTMLHFIKLVLQHEANEKVKIKVLRNGEYLTFDYVLGVLKIPGQSVIEIK